jgi:predicted Zn-dependent protease
MKRAWIRLLAALGAACLAGCAGAPAMVSTALARMDVNDVQNLYQQTRDFSQKWREVSPAEEAALGAGIASNMLGAAPLWPDRKAQQYVNTVGHWVAQQSERADLDWHFAVLDDSDLNAFALPGGYVFITRGLLLSLRNEAELAGVLGHEIAHVVRKHHLQAMRSQSFWQYAGGLGGFVLDKNAGTVPGVDPRLVEWGTRTARAATEVYARGLDKDAEFEADRMGVVLAARAGYDAYGLPAVLQTLQAVNPNAPALALLFKTHPSFDARLDALAQVMTADFDRFDGQPTLAQRFRANVALPKPGR